MVVARISTGTEHRPTTRRISGGFWILSRAAVALSIASAPVGQRRGQWTGPSRLSKIPHLRLGCSWN
jgi:hypothetical protein